MKRAFILSLFLFLTVSVWGQLHPERKYIRSGNRAYTRENYVESEEAYRKAVEKTPESYAAGSNLASSLYKQERYEEAAQLYEQYGKTAQTAKDSAQNAYNLGNALFQQRELEKALEAYKASLRVNPDDQEAKFNLAYTKKLLEKDQENDGGGGQDNQNNQDQNDQDQSQNQPDQQDQDPQDPQNDEQNQDQQNDEQNQDPQNNEQDQDNSQQQGSSGMTPEEADAMLDAMQREEDNTREKIDARQVPAVGRSGKNW